MKCRIGSRVVNPVGLVSLLLAVVLGACATTKIYQEGQVSFDLGLMLFDQGKFPEALPYFQRATAENPKFAQAYLYIGRTQLSMRRWRDALQPLRTAYRLSPEEAKDEVFNILMDALVAAAVDGLGPGSSSKPSP